MKVKVSEELRITGADPEGGARGEFYIVRKFGKEGQLFFTVKKSEIKGLREALHAIETGDLSDEEKAPWGKPT